MQKKNIYHLAQMFHSTNIKIFELKSDRNPLFFSVMYEQDSLVDDPQVFLDPNSLSDDGTVSLRTTAFSEDGSKFAYGLSKSGSDWFDVHFKNVETGKDYS